MQTLQTLIELISKERNLHISILDLVGILDTPATRVSFKNVIHSKNFCNIAKSTPRGYHACLRCKMLANMKAADTKVAFCGSCIYGIYEQAYPVVINGNVAAIIYVGNAVVDKDSTVSAIIKACALTGVRHEELINELAFCEYVKKPDELLSIAEIVSDYIKLLYNSQPYKSRKLNWLVSLMKRYADEMFCSNISLKELAASCRKNEKYLGRLYKKEMGMSFTEYCTKLRLEKAQRALLETNEKIIDIAFDCGFNNISYFNRVFRKQYSMSPKEYRQKQMENILFV